LERVRKNDCRADTFVFGIVKYLGNFFSPVSDILNYCLIFMGPNEVLTLKEFLEVKLCIWSSTSTKPIKLEYFVHINVTGLWLKTVLQNITPGELSLGQYCNVLVKTTMDLLSCNGIAYTVWRYRSRNGTMIIILLCYNMNNFCIACLW